MNKIINKDYIINLKNKLFSKTTLYRIIIFITGSIIFGLAYRQAPLYRSNQHTKFLHGIAWAGFGNLKNDWFAHTIDPLPLFSSIVFLTKKFLHEYFFYFYFILILGVFIFSIIGILSHIFKLKYKNTEKLVLFSIIITLHSTIADSISYKFFGFRLFELILEKGVARQYLLGSIFQPCVFGVFILLSIFLFLKNKHFLSIFVLCISCNIHTAYLYSAGLLTLIYMILIAVYKKDIKKAFFIGIFALILVIPNLLYNYIYLGPTSTEAMKESMDILVNRRIPHHADPRRWFNLSSIIKMSLITFSLIIVRKSKLFFILSINFVIAILLTILQFFINNDFLAFIMPWRVSVWLTPLATCIILGYLIDLIFKHLKNLTNKLNKVIIILCGIILFFHLTYGSYRVIMQFHDYLNIDHGEMMNFVSDNKKINDIYLVPMKLHEFRLNTGAPVLITKKSHPYKDIELLEWYKRVQDAEEFYDNKGFYNKELLETLKKEYGITQVVIEIKKVNSQYNGNINSNDVMLVYKDNEYCIYKIK